jgi:hypothetical protein
MAALYRSHGYTLWKTETWDHWTKQKRDLLGFIDAIALGNGELIGIQVFGLGEWNRHVEKVYCDCQSEFEAWCAAGGRVQFVGWRRLQENGTKRKAWYARIEELHPAQNLDTCTGSQPQ